MPGRLLALVVAIAFAMVLPGVPAGAERPEGSAASLARARILYVWTDDAQARDEFDTLFSDFGAIFTTVNVEQAAAADLSLIDYIVIGHDTARDGITSGAPKGRTTRSTSSIRGGQSSALVMAVRSSGTASASNGSAGYSPR